MIEGIVERALGQLEARLVEASVPIRNWRVRECVYEGPGAYRDVTHDAARVVRMSSESIIARADVTLPGAWSGRNAYLEIPVPFRCHIEGLVLLDGAPLAGFDRFHTRLLVVKEGAFRSPLEITLEAKMARAEWDALARDGIALIVRDRVVDGYRHDLSAAFDLWKAHKDETFRACLWEVVSQSVERCRLGAEDPDASISAGADRLRDGLVALRKAYPHVGRVGLVGHSHIDIAWHWQLKETVRKCARTFSTALNLMREYPEFVFSASQARLYDDTRRNHPAVYERMRHEVERERWEILGGAWVEFDANVPCGESLVRQHLHGQRFFERAFGRRACVAWLPDTFGFSGNLPQIMRDCGLHYFYTYKLHWQSRDRFPYGLFWWEGLDGTRVLAHTPFTQSGYGGEATPHEALFAWENFPEKRLCDEVMVPYGYGDGGGGVTREMLESIRRSSALPGMPDCRISRADDLFERMHAQVAERADTPVWRGELYLETHRGTFTTKAALKRLNREAERLYLSVEKVASLLMGNGIVPDLTGLKEGWLSILTNQFHDILGGVCEREVNEDAIADYESAIALGQERLLENLTRLALHVNASGMTAPRLLLNSLSLRRDDVVELEVPLPCEKVTVIDRSGERLDCQVVDSEAGRILCAVKDVPALGYAVIDVRQGEVQALPDLNVTARTLENRFYRVTFDEAGNAYVFDRLRGRDVFAPGEPGNVFEFFHERSSGHDAWNIDRDFERSKETVRTAEIALSERGPLRSSVRITRRFGRSVIEQDVVMYRDLPRIDFRTRVDWQERNVMLKAAFPVNARASTATFEIPYGVLERPTHTNTSWDQEKFEAPAQRWADLSEPGFGVTVLNDCKYGYDVRGNVLRLTLLRSTSDPEPDADRGSHTFRYAIVTHDGDWRRGGIIQRAAEFNEPLISQTLEPTSGSLAKRLGLAEVDADNVVITAVKKAEESDDLVMRLFESHGERGNVTVTFGFPVKAVVETNMLEDPGASLPVNGNRAVVFMKPYEIKTLLVKQRDGVDPGGLSWRKE